MKSVKKLKCLRTSLPILQSFTRFYKKCVIQTGHLWYPKKTSLWELSNKAWISEVLHSPRHLWGHFSLKLWGVPCHSTTICSFPICNWGGTFPFLVKWWLVTIKLASELFHNIPRSWIPTHSPRSLDRISCFNCLVALIEQILQCLKSRKIWLTVWNVLIQIAMFCPEALLSLLATMAACQPISTPCFHILFILLIPPFLYILLLIWYHCWGNSSQHII